jgi:hypothetical protein
LLLLFDLVGCIHLTEPNPLSSVAPAGVGSMAAAAAALAVTDELVLPLRAVGDLAAAAGVSREEVVVITQCASLGQLLNPLPLFHVLGLVSPADQNIPRG